MDNINVAIRLRPLNEREKNSGSQEGWSFKENSIWQKSEARNLPTTPVFIFDEIFREQESTIKVYKKTAEDIIKSTMNGFNGTIFAYGQTSSGKTHTMQGNEEEPGIIPLAIRDIFDYILNTPGREFLLRVSYMEIYNEVIQDLLNPENRNLKIHENPDREVFVGGISEKIVLSPEEVFDYMNSGEQNRHVGETNMNDHSSRSHTIFRMVIESREKSVDGAVKVSCLNLVDLAGSERVSLTGAEGIRLKEGGHINKSLLTLGTVIAKLSEQGNESTHIPYRDSKLTRILQNSLGGNARTCIICTITPATNFIEETKNTLKFASRAKSICNKPEMNEVLSEEALLKRYRKEISELKDQLKLMSNDTMPCNQAQNEEMMRKFRQQEEEKERIKQHYDKLKKMIIDSSIVEKKKKSALSARRRTWFVGYKDISPMKSKSYKRIHEEGEETNSKHAKIDYDEKEITHFSKGFESTIEILLKKIAQLKEQHSNEKEQQTSKYKNLLLSIDNSDTESSDNESSELQILISKLNQYKRTMNSLKKNLERQQHVSNDNYEFLQMEAEAMRQVLTEKEEDYMKEIESLRCQLETEKQLRQQDVLNAEFSSKSIISKLEEQLCQMEEETRDITEQCGMAVHRSKEMQELYQLDLKQKEENLCQMNNYAKEINHLSVLIKEKEEQIKELENDLKQKEENLCQSNNYVEELNELSVLCSEKEEQIKELEYVLKQKEQNLCQSENYVKELNQLSVLIKEKEEQIKELENENHSLKDEKESYASELELKSENEELVMKRVVKYETLAFDLEKNLVSKEKEFIASLEEKEKQHNLALFAKEQEMDYLKEEIDKLNQNLEEKDTFIGEYIQEVEELKFNLKQIEVERVIPTDEKLRECKLELEKKIESISTLEDLLANESKECSILKEQLKNKNESISELEALLSNESKECSTLKEQLKNKDKSISELEDLLSNESKECINLKEQLKNKNESISELEDLLRKEPVDSSFLKEQMETLSEKCKEQKKLLYEKEEHEKSLATIISSLQAEVEKLTDKEEALMNLRMDLNCNEATAKELEIQKEQVVVLTNINEEKVKEVESLKELINNLEQEEEILKENLALLNGEVEDITAELHWSQQKLNEYEKELQNKERKDNNANSQSAQLSHMEKTIQQLQESEENWKKECWRLIGECDVLHDKVEELTSKLIENEKNSSSNDLLKQENFQLKIELDNTIRKYNQAEEELKQNNKKLHLEIDNLHEQLEKKSAEISSTYQELCLQKDSTDNNIRKYSQIEEELKKNNEKLQLEIDNLHEQLEIKSAELSSTYQELCLQKDSAEKFSHLHEKEALELNELELNFKNLTSKLEEQEIFILQLKESIHSAEEKNRALEEQKLVMEETLNWRINNLSDQLEEKSTELSSTCQELNLQKDSTDEFLRLHRKKESEFNDLLLQNEKLSNELAKCQLDLEILNEKNDSLADLTNKVHETEVLTSQLAEFKTNESFLKEQLDTLEKELEHQRHLVKELNIHLSKNAELYNEEKASLVNQLNVRNTAYRKEVGNLQNEILAMSEMHRATKSSIMKLESNCLNSMHEMKIAFQMSMKSFFKKGFERDEEILKLTKNLEEKKREMENKQYEIDQIIEKMDQGDKESAKKLLQESFDFAKKWEDQKNHNEREMERIKAMFKKEIAKAKSQLSKEKGIAFQQIKDLESRVSEFTRLLQDANRQVKELQVEVETANSEIVKHNQETPLNINSDSSTSKNLEREGFEELQLKINSLQYENTSLKAQNRTHILIKADEINKARQITMELQKTKAERDRIMLELYQLRENKSEKKVEAHRVSPEEYVSKKRPTLNVPGDENNAASVNKEIEGTSTPGDQLVNSRSERAAQRARIRTTQAQSKQGNECNQQ